MDSLRDAERKWSEVMQCKQKEKDLEEKVIEISTERLKGFKNHPFKVKNDAQMEALRESIGRFGILNPIIVRPKLEGYYEIISGHRRCEAARQLGFTKVPVLIRVLSDDEAILEMVDSNVQREQISPSEKAFAYRMKYDVLRRSVGRPKSGQIGYVYPKGKSPLQEIGAEAGDSQKQVQRYIRITYLIPELLKLLDEGMLAFNPAVDLSFLSEEEQKELLNAMNATQSSPSISQAQRIKELSKSGNCTQEKMQEILGEIKKGETNRVMFKNEQLYRFFPRSYTPAQMKKEIVALLQTYCEQYWGN